MDGVWVTTGRTYYKTEIGSRQHCVIADEPMPLGTDLSPTPYEFLLIALGSCVNMTLRMYADRKGWDLESVEVA